MGYRDLTQTALEQKPRSATRRKCLWLVGLFGLYWLASNALPPRKKQRAAFVVLTDPRERHEENVIPMLTHVEQKYGWSRGTRAGSLWTHVVIQAGLDTLTLFSLIKSFLRKRYRTLLETRRMARQRGI